MWSARPFNSNNRDPFGRNPDRGDGGHLIAESVKCPACASNIFFMPEVKGMVCRNCGNIYDPSTLEKTGSFGFSIEHDYTGDNEISEDDRKRHEIVCDSCGATMIADENMMSTMCPFCGSPALITRRMTREFKPDYILPFKIDKQTAENNMKKWLKTRKITPRGFKSRSRLTKMTPLYVPFWLVDCAVNTDLYGTGRNTKDEITTTYSVTSKVKYYVKNVPFDASLKIANKLMEAIEPFDFSELVKFDKRYLQGFYADKYDQGPFELMDRYIKRMSRISLDMSDSISSKYDSYEPAPERDFTWMSDLNIKYCLLPVWFVTVEFDGRNLQFAVNGQTGEASGQAPTSSAVDKLDSIISFSRSVWRWVPVTAVVILPVIAYVISTLGNTNRFFYVLVMAILFIEVVLIAAMAIVSSLRRAADRASLKIHKTADLTNDFDKAPGIDTYLDTTRRTEIKVDDFLVRREFDSRNAADDEYGGFPIMMK